MDEVTTRARVFSNGAYGVLVTEQGSGYSALRGFALTRWQPDPTVDHQGVILYLRDRETGAYWSIVNCNVNHHADGVEQCCTAQDIEMRCTAGVLAHVNAETRRIRITNRSGRPRRLELTTYVELALNAPAADAAHPAFSKLFIQTAHDAGRKALIAWRRLRSPDDRPLWVAQRLLGFDGALEIETDRTRFIGRTRSVVDPLALSTSNPLSGTVGAVLDPIFSIRAAFELDADASVELELQLCAADSRAEVERLLDQPHDGMRATSSDGRVMGLPHNWRVRISSDGQPFNSQAAVNNADGAAPVTRASYGNFSDDGSEYVLTVGGDLQPTPQPWINVVANEQCGFLISETGAGYTWTANSRENRLTPWSNDSTSDPHSEALYLRDDTDGSFWSLLPGPAPADARYEVRHGFGYTRFSHASHELTQAVTLFVPRHDPVKIIRLRIHNDSQRARQLSVISYAQLVLGGTAAEMRGAVTTVHESDIIFAHNTERGEFSQRVAFATAVCDARTPRSASGSRRSFIGDAGTLSRPAALLEQSLDERFGADTDPCAALQLSLTVEAGASVDCAFLLGEAEDAAAARACLARYRSLADIDAASANVTAFWQELLATIEVHTPVPALDVMFNGWLAYQNLACRMWARSAFYQSGGAFGFRDQLQDASALLYLDPGITRDQILLHAAHQFAEGDVLHWWHPPTSKGIRTRFADDLLWLPQITVFYVARTGDRAILDEEVRFLTAERLPETADEIFVWPRDSGESASLYEHCCRAIDRSLTVGTHGLPLMGVGDWNDGMNRVGREGRGESVWLGFFLFDILSDFIPLCEARGDRAHAARYHAYKAELQEALNQAGWDGGWYRRAYYDDGTPLGSAQNDECRIDALAQAWAIISGAAPPKRAAQALAAMQAHLVSERDGIIRLLTPAFDKTPQDPGYIKGYIPGVRENGGQYTHAALWAVRALAEFGESERAAPLLEMLSPITRAAQPDVYGGEPYVIAADVYGEPPHVGRAGWTWYTGSAGWMYRVFLESILGFELVAGRAVRLRPCIPASWPGFSLRYRLADGTVYRFEVERCADTSSTSIGVVENGAIVIPLTRDGTEHIVRVRAGPDVRPRYRPRSSDVPLLRTASAKK